MEFQHVYKRCVYVRIYTMDMHRWYEGILMHMIMNTYVQSCHAHFMHRLLLYTYTQLLALKIYNSTQACIQLHLEPWIVIIIKSLWWGVHNKRCIIIICIPPQLVLGPSQRSRAQLQLHNTTSPAGCTVQWTIQTSQVNMHSTQTIERKNTTESLTMIELAAPGLSKMNDWSTSLL